MSSQLTFNLTEGALSFSFTPTAAQELKAALTELMTRLKATTQAGPTAGRANPQKPMEYRYTGDVFLEIFCNPNIWPTPFAAKVLITLRDDRIRITTETALTRLQEDLNQYLEQVS